MLQGVEAHGGIAACFISRWTALRVGYGGYKYGIFDDLHVKSSYHSPRLARA